MKRLLIPFSISLVTFSVIKANAGCSEDQAKWLKKTRVFARRDPLVQSLPLQRNTSLSLITWGQFV
jgi:hypothetical protein